jgi:septum formation protein
MSRLILASNSPRRRELLAELVSEFDIVPSAFEEEAEGLSAYETALAFAAGKAEEVFSRYPSRVVLGADTVVALDGKILGKPHSVFTGVCLRGKDLLKKDVAETLVTFRPLTPKTIAEYVKSGSPMDKAGAYGIQDGILVRSYQGSYTNVVGLPLELVRTMLKEGGIC